MKAISKVIAVLAVSALAFGMFGCSSEPEQTTTNADEAQTYTSEEINASGIEIEKSGYSPTTQTSVDADGNPIDIPAIDFAFIAKNNNAGYVAENVPFNVNGYNEAGEIVFSGGATCMYIYPGIDTAVSGTTAISEVEGLDTTITEFTVEPLMDTVEWLKTGLNQSQIEGMFTVENVNAERVDNDVTITASVTGDLAYADKIYKIVDLENTLEGHAVAIFTNANGDIVFGSDSTNILLDQTMLDSVKGAEGEGEDGEAVPLNNVSLSVQNAPEYTDFQLYVMPGL